VWAKLTGSQVLNALLLIVLAAVVVYMIDESDQKAVAREVDVVAAMHALREAVDRQSEMQQAFIFVLSLRQSERETQSRKAARALRNAGLRSGAEAMIDSASNARARRAARVAGRDHDIASGGLLSDRTLRHALVNRISIAVSVRFTPSGRVSTAEAANH
jgi:hypothetical protein